MGWGENFTIECMQCASDYFDYVFSNMPVCSISKTQKISHFSKKCPKKSHLPRVARVATCQKSKSYAFRTRIKKKFHLVQVDLLSP